MTDEHKTTKWHERPATWGQLICATSLLLPIGALLVAVWRVASHG